MSASDNPVWELYKMLQQIGHPQPCFLRIVSDHFELEEAIAVCQIKEAAND